MKEQEFTGICPMCGEGQGNISPESGAIYYSCCGFEENNVEMLDD